MEACLEQKGHRGVGSRAVPAPGCATGWRGQPPSDPWVLPKPCSRLRVPQPPARVSAGLSPQLESSSKRQQKCLQKGNSSIAARLSGAAPCHQGCREGCACVN